MKRTGNLYEKIYSMENLKEAHLNARKGKTWYKQVQEVDENTEEYLTQLQEMLINKTYQTSEYEIFKINDSGKEREIYKLPYFPDRICQWAILQVIQPYLLKNLTNDTYSAIPNRGIHLALGRIRKAVKDENMKYCLKTDVSKYYPNINQELMMDKFKRMFKDGDLIWILDEIVKSTDSGIPIGNYLSQWCGNLYLSDFDHWIKEVKGIKYYYRYMDDCVFLASSKEELHQLRLEIEMYLGTKLKLKLKKSWQVFPISRGIDFVGYRIYPKFILLRKSTYKNLKKKSNYIKVKLKNDKPLEYGEWCSMNSYKGWLKHGNCYNLYKQYIGCINKELKQFYLKEVKQCKK